MKKSWRRAAFYLWLSIGALFILSPVWPVNALAIRIVLLCSFGGVIGGSLFFAWWRRNFFLALSFLYCALGGFLLLPGHDHFNVNALSAANVDALRAYDGTPYFWGGENRNGIDCSGLVRKGMENALFLQGTITLNPQLVRQAFDLWWNDGSARDMRDGYGERTEYVADCESLNHFDASALLPGDLAVTTSGVHVMAYLGGNEWIGADPNAGKVVISAVPDDGDPWFSCPMRIVRWRAFKE